MEGESEPEAELALLAGDTAVIEPDRKSKPKKAKAAVVSAADEKPAKTRQYRGKVWPVVKTTRDRKTGAIYDYVEITRTTVNRFTKAKTVTSLVKRLRRAGTGVTQEREVEIVE